MLDIVIEARNASIGDALVVRRILPFRRRRMVGPFIFMDHAGPTEIPESSSSKYDVLPHPHIGLSTVSYLLDGRVTHRDSLGVEQVIKPGEVNWMTAGRGIAHSERFEDPSLLQSQRLEMIQTWVALPEKEEESAPEFHNYPEDKLPVHTDTGIWMRMIAGQAFGLHSPVKTLSPLFYIHAVLEPGTPLSLPQEHEERGVYIVNGEIEVNGHSYSNGTLLVFRKETDPVIKAKAKTNLMLLGGAPLGDRYIWWNFVSSRRDRIEAAKADWKAGNFKLPPHDQESFIPLPEDNSRPAGGPPPPNPLS